MLKKEKNAELTKRFDAIYPGGHSNFRIALEAGEVRTFLTKGKGARVWDVDGNEYIDYLGAMGPNILGHCHPEYVQTLKDFLDTMSLAVGSGILYTPVDVEVAEKIAQHVPCAERVKFCVSGTEAVQCAIRLARAHAKKRYFIRFEGHYHGWADNVLGGVLDRAPQGKPFPIESQEDFCFTEGRDPDAFNQGFLLPWNDIEALEKTLDAYGDEVAMIHLEAIVCNHNCMPPLPGYLERMKELCAKHEIVLSFDEVITGFRLGLGGAQETLGITPDMATFGKAIAAGAPCSAVVGNKAIMDQLRDRKVLGPGTFMGNPFGLTAALTTIKILEKDDGAVYKEIDRLQGRLTEGLKEIAARRGLPLFIQGTRGVFFTLFGLEGDVLYREEDFAAADLGMLMQFWNNLFEEGVIMMIIGRWYMSAGMTDKDIDETLEAADRAMAKF